MIKWREKDECVPVHDSAELIVANQVEVPPLLSARKIW